MGPDPSDSRRTKRTICRFLGSGLDSDGHFSTSRLYRRSPEATRHKSLASCFTIHEKRKKREYLERLRNVEHPEFTPLVIATTGGIGRGFYDAQAIGPYPGRKERDVHICARRMASMPPFFRNSSFGIDLSSWVPTLQTQEGQSGQRHRFGCQPV